MRSPTPSLPPNGASRSPHPGTPKPHIPPPGSSNLSSPPPLIPSPLISRPPSLSCIPSHDSHRISFLFMYSFSSQPSSHLKDHPILCHFSFHIPSHPLPYILSYQVLSHNPFQIPNSLSLLILYFPHPISPIPHIPFCILVLISTCIPFTSHPIPPHALRHIPAHHGRSHAN